MQTVKWTHLQNESDSWKRLMEFIKDENIHLKNRLSAILKEISNKDLLEKFEYFHNQFMRKDELIALLRNDIAELDELLLREKFEDKKMEISNKINQLRNNVDSVEEQFKKLKVDFNNYISEYV